MNQIQKLLKTSTIASCKKSHLPYHKAGWSLTNTTPRPQQSRKKLGKPAEAPQKLQGVLQ